jgi:polysaccharide deacetylase family protein (PEP-CTERM system associated)
MQNYLTIDVEDYFQVSAFADIVSIKNWETMEQRVQLNTESILHLLKKYGIKATFFIVGWTAEKHPQIVRDIMADGHDIGCHGYWHRPVYELSPQEFLEDTLKAKDILESLCGKKIISYRAPSYSITKKSLWALDILKKTGFRIDSSIFPIVHDIYGIPDSPRFCYTHPVHGLKEFPITTILICGQKIPVGGGGYFRLFPYWFTKLALKKINNKEKQPFVFYLHPWEIDTGQPRFNNARMFSRFRHYNNLAKTMDRFERLLNDFDFIPLPNN